MSATNASARQYCMVLKVPNTVPQNPHNANMDIGPRCMLPHSAAALVVDSLCNGNPEWPLCNCNAQQHSID